MKSLSLFAPLVLAALLSGPALAEEAKAATKPDLTKGAATATAVCGACHAFDGSRGLPTYPILQGQHPEYIVKQLTEFKAGKRANAIMMGMAATLPTEDDMKNVAAFYAGKSAKPGAAKSKDTVLLGEKIYRGGIADRAVPACSGCHGPSGAGLPAQYPRLAGQHAEYASAQLKSFKAGTRTNSVQMAAIAGKLTDAEIDAVSDYVAGLH